MLNQEALGIDIGGVIIARVGRRRNTSFISDNSLETPAVPDAFDAVRRLVAERFRGKVFLVSKCHKPIQDKTLRWLGQHCFYEQTGVQRDHVYFCRKRDEKAAICSELEITHFVDDRIDVLKNMGTVMTLYWFHPTFRDIRRNAQFLHLVRRANSWKELLEELLPRKSQAADFQKMEHRIGRSLPHSDHCDIGEPVACNHQRRISRTPGVTPWEGGGSGAGSVNRYLTR